MITTDCPDDLKKKLMDAISGTFSMCAYKKEYRIATLAVVEFLTALNLTHDEVFEVTRQAYGMDVDTDNCIDEILEAFEE